MEFTCEYIFRGFSLVLQEPSQYEDVYPKILEKYNELIIRHTVCVERVRKYRMRMGKNLLLFLPLSQPVEQGFDFLLTSSYSRLLSREKKSFKQSQFIASTAQLTHHHRFPSFPLSLQICFYALPIMHDGDDCDDNNVVSQ
jgi:hypothetical protein